MNRYNLLSKINDYNDDFYKKNNRKPTKNEIINHFNISSKQYEEIMQISQPHSYLFEKSSSDKDDDFQVIDCISSDFFQSTDIYIKNTSKQETIDAILSILDEREQDIIKSCYGFDDMTLNDLEEKYDICKTRIDQIKYEALKKLRTTEGINKLKQVLNNND